MQIVSCICKSCKFQFNVEHSGFSYSFIHLFIYLLSQGAQSMIGKTFYQSIVINQENYLIGIDRYWSIDDQYMVTH